MLFDNSTSVYNTVIIKNINMLKIKKLLFKSDKRREKYKKIFLTHQLKSIAITGLLDWTMKYKAVLAILQLSVRRKI